MRTLVTLLVFWTASSALAQVYDVRCWGYNLRNNNYVDGRCQMGTFTGYEWATGHWVYGSCQPGSQLSAYNQVTGDWVYGQCDRIPLLDER